MRGPGFRMEFVSGFVPSLCAWWDEHHMCRVGAQNTHKDRVTRVASPICQWMGSFMDEQQIATLNTQGGWFAEVLVT